jgi:magnesium chelatase family protein
MMAILNLQIMAVFSAIKNTGLTFPPTKITVNLAPADTRKVGPLFDLPIATGILISSEQLPISEKIHKTLFLGELALDGRLRRVTGVLPIVSAAKKKGLTSVFLPKENAAEASLVEGMTVFGANTLKEVVDHFHGVQKIEPQKPLSEEEIFADNSENSYIDFSSIAGQ